MGSFADASPTLRRGLGRSRKASRVLLAVVIVSAISFALSASEFWSGWTTVAGTSATRVGSYTTI